MAAETRLIVLFIGVLWMLWDMARTLKRIEEKLGTHEEILSDIRFVSKNIGRQFLPPKE